ncbi:MAG: type II secretion system F family protein [Candidatus Latescibacterota bacterium]
MSAAPVAAAVFGTVFFASLVALVLAGQRLDRGRQRLRCRLRALAASLEPPAAPQHGLLRDRAASAIGVVDRILSRLPVTAHLQQRLDEAGMSTRSGTLLLGSLSLAGLAWLVASPYAPLVLIPLAAAAVAGLLPYAWVLRRRRIRLDRFDELLPEAIDLMSNGLRSGFSLEACLRLVAQEIPGPVGGEFAVTFEEQNLGLELCAALENMARRVPSHDLKIMTTAITIQKRTGGNLTEVLSQIAEMIRERFTLRRDIRIYTAQGRLSGVILAVLPLVMVLVMSVLQPELVRVLLLDPTGRSCLAVAVVLQAAGFVVIRRITGVQI